MSEVANQTQVAARKKNRKRRKKANKTDAAPENGTGVLADKLPKASADTNGGSSIGRLGDSGTCRVRCVGDAGGL